MVVLARCDCNIKRLDKAPILKAKWDVVKSLKLKIANR